MHVLLDQQDRRPLGAQAREQLEDLIDDDRREPERGLVEQEQRRPRHERPADREHLLLAARERAAVLAQPLAQDREEAQHVLVGGVEVGAIARDRTAEPQVVGHREPREHAPPLGRERDPAAHDRLGRELVDRLALEPHLPARDRHEADDRVQQARLARAVGAQQGDDLALLDVQRHVLHGHDGAVADDEVVDGEDVHARRPQRSGLRRCTSA